MQTNCSSNKVPLLILFSLLRCSAFRVIFSEYVVWPSRSPDLNPIETMWGLLVRNLQWRRLVRDELSTAITEAWHSLPQNYFRNLCLSTHSRLNKVIEANAAMTKYLVFNFYLFILYFLLIKTSFYSISLIFKTS
jgi:hypothetical protein